MLNDATATALDVQRSRGHRGLLLLLALGTGVGVAVLDNGAPLDVENGTPGHLGQIDVSVPGHPVVMHGRSGGLRRRARLASRLRPGGVGRFAAFTGEESAVQALVRAIRIAHAIYRPHHVCVCGGIGVRLRHLRATIDCRTHDHLTCIARPDYMLSFGDDDFHAARGAAHAAGTQAR